MKEPLIKANRVFKYSITFQETNEESREVSDFSDSGFIIENETDEIGDILKLAQQTYGIYYPISFGGWESTTPEHNAKYFEKGIETYYALFIKNEDGTDITEEEYDFITFLLSDGNYNKSEFTDYAVGGVVLGALALGVGGLIAYYYFNKRKKGYPTGSAWTKEHYHDNEDEDYEVEPSKRKVPARNRKYVNGGGVDDYDYEDIGQFSMPDSEWKNYSQEDFNRIGRKIVEEQFNGDLTRAYDSIVHKRTYFVVSAKNDKVVSRGFDTEEEAKKEMYSMFEKTGDFSYGIKKFDNGGDVREMDWFKGFKETKPIEMVVVTKEAEKDGGNEIIFNIIVEAQNDTLAYQEARKKWQMENGLSDLSIVKVYTKDEYVNSKKMANGGTTTTRPTTTPEVVPDTDTKPRKPKTPYTPKHTPLIKPKARKYDFILIKK